MDVNDDYVLILFDIPSVEIRHNQEAYTTIPLGLYGRTMQLSRCVRRRHRCSSILLSIIYEILPRRSRCVLPIRLCTGRACYISRIFGLLTGADLRWRNVWEAQRRMPISSTCMRWNPTWCILIHHCVRTGWSHRLTRYSGIRKFPEDQELLDDVIVENLQAIEMTQIYRYLKGYTGIDVNIH